MKKTITLAGLTVALALTAFVGGNNASDVKSPSLEEISKAMAEAGRPGAEHGKLQPLAGSWNYTCRCWMDPSGSPIETRGTIERKWILGGRFLEEQISGTGFDGKTGFEAFGLLGYNNNAKTYVSTFACNMSTGLSTGIGSSQGNGSFTFQTTCACPLSKQPVLGRDVIRIESYDRVVSEAYKVVEGKEVKVMEIVATRRK